MCMIAHRAKAGGKALGIYFPCSCVHPTPVICVPAGVHPEIIEFHLLFDITIDEHDFVPVSGLGHFDILPRSVPSQLWRRQLTSAPRHVVRHHPATPQVLRPSPLAFPKHQHNARGANFFPGQQFEMSKLLTSTNLNSVPTIPRELTGPLTWPTHNDNGPLIRPR